MINIIECLSLSIYLIVLFNSIGNKGVCGIFRNQNIYKYLSRRISIHKIGENTSEGNLWPCAYPIIIMTKQEQLTEEVSDFLLNLNAKEKAKEIQKEINLLWVWIPNCPED